MLNNTLVAGGFVSKLNAVDPLSTGSPGGFVSMGMGDAIHRTKCMLKCNYSFVVQGGATGSVAMVDDLGNSATLPKGAYVTNVVVSVKTSLASSSSGAFALSVLTTADLMAAKTTLPAASLYAGVPVGTAATWVGPITAAAGSVIDGVISVGALTGIVIQAFVEFNIGDF